MKVQNLRTITQVSYLTVGNASGVLLRPEKNTGRDCQTCCLSGLVMQYSFRFLVLAVGITTQRSLYREQLVWIWSLSCKLFWLILNNPPEPS